MLGRRARRAPCRAVCTVSELVCTTAERRKCSELSAVSVPAAAATMLSERCISPTFSIIITERSRRHVAKVHHVCGCLGFIDAPL